MENNIEEFTTDEEDKRENNSENSGSDESEEIENTNEVSLPVINPISFIRNKEKRNAIFKKIQQEKKKKQKQERRKRRQNNITAKHGHTIESLRERDATTVENLDNSENEELRKDLELDELSSYFSKHYAPKVLITFSENPGSITRKFGLELSRVLPDALVKIRRRSSIKETVQCGTKNGFTDIIVINDNKRKPNGILVIHLPEGPTTHFKLSNLKLTKDLHRSYKEINKHRPEVILTNFTTRLGFTVGRTLGALFHHDPEFHGRRVVTFHNQRDFIFFRHHRYEFSKEGKRVKLRELGPRFTLKLRSIQEGTFDSKCGDYIWVITNKRHLMEGRRRFFL